MNGMIIQDHRTSLNGQQMSNMNAMLMSIARWLTQMQMRIHAGCRNSVLFLTICINYANMLQQQCTTNCCNTDSDLLTFDDVIDVLICMWL